MIVGVSSQASYLHRMVGSSDEAGASQLDPAVALNAAEIMSRSAFSCSDLDKLADEDDMHDEEEDDAGRVTAEEMLASDDSNMVTTVLVTLLFAGFLAVCGAMVVQMLRADEAAFARRLEQRMPQVQAKHIRVDVGLAQLYTGGRIQIDVDRRVVCSKCAGTGEDASSGFHSCHKCHGTGVYEALEQIGPFQQRVRSVCNVCQGRGRVANSKCEVCRGHGLRRESTTLGVYVQPGVRHGDELLLAREGDQALHHVPGHIVVHVALVGFTREIIHLDGRTVKLHREAVVQPAAIWPIPGEGIPRRNLPGEFGSLLVHFNIAYPTELDAAAKAAVCQLLSERVEPSEAQVSR